MRSRDLDTQWGQDHSRQGATWGQVLESWNKKEEKQSEN